MIATAMHLSMQKTLAIADFNVVEDFQATRVSEDHQATRLP
jgi:hypothetical protein